jgi:aspartate/methionine/tyrosine aminotransferase
MIPPRPSRRAAVAPFMAMDVLRDARRLEAEGRRIVHMELGEPGAPAPRGVRVAAVAALREGAIGYGEAGGEAALRRRIALHYRDYYGVEVEPERVVVATGSSGAFMLALLAAFDAGARIGVFVPGYPAYLNILEALGLLAVPIALQAEMGHAPTVEAVQAAHRAKRLYGLLIMSPSNPTGVVIPADELARICDFCRSEGIVLIADEIYHRLEYGERADTALRFLSEAVVVNSFSKYYAMTGWRLGWAVAPESLAPAMERLQQSLAICAPTLAQRAALAAFDGVEELEAVKAGYARSRALLMRRLPEIGLSRFAPPDGAFYVYMDVSDLTADSPAFCAALLREAGVATTPGVDFDRARGATTLRLSYAGPEAEVALGLDRLGDWLARRG